MMDKHVSKIFLEAVQNLCSAKRILDPDVIETNHRIWVYSGAKSTPYYFSFIYL